MKKNNNGWYLIGLICNGISVIFFITVTVLRRMEVDNVNTMVETTKATQKEELASIRCRLIVLEISEDEKKKEEERKNFSKINPCVCGNIKIGFEKFWMPGWFYCFCTGSDCHYDARGPSKEKAIENWNNFMKVIK